MTQDQCLDNGHQVASSSHSAGDKTSDEPNNSNNSTFKSGINTAQEFNVDVNSKRIDQQSADVVIVQNCVLDTDRSSTDKVLISTENSDSTANNTSNANTNSLAAKMTVITHQSSDENIREIILHPDDLNKIPNDSQVNIESELIHEINYNKPNSKDKPTLQNKGDVSSTSEIEKPEDPIERLNKLRASISSALSEVKGVLRQYSTEQSFDGEPESSLSSKPADNGPIRFRFVRKIRRRSVFSEEDSDVTSQKSITGDAITLDTPSACKPLVESAKIITKIENEQTISPSLDVQKLHSSNEMKDNSKVTQSINNVLALDNDKKVKDIVADENKTSFIKIENLQNDSASENVKKDNNSNDVVTKKIKLVEDNINLNIVQKPINDASKTTKSKKIIKKDRRASVTLGSTSSQLDLKAQRRPSDSGTIVKHSTKTKPKTSEKPKSTPQVLTTINKAENSVINNLHATHYQVPESEEVDKISNSSKISTEDVRSVFNVGPTIPAADNLPMSLTTSQPLKLDLDIAALLEPSKANTKKEENIPDTDVPVSQRNETLTHNQQEKEGNMVISDSPMNEVLQTNPETIQNTEVVPNANIQGELSETSIDLTPSKSVETKSESEGDTAPIITEEPKPVVVEAPAPVKNKKKAKRKVVIRRIKRKLSKDDTFIQIQETPAELEIEEKEIEEKDANDDVAEEAEVEPKQRKPCIKPRQFEIGDIVMYAERYKKTQVKWRKAKIIERITSISYKLDIDGEEKPAHISYIKKFTDRKVNFGGKEYLEIDYAQIEEDEEKERNYSIWNMV